MNLGLALKQFGKDTIVVDTNFNNPNVSSYLGNPFPYPSINSALMTDMLLSQAASTHRSGLRYIPGNMKLDSPSPLVLSESLVNLEGSCEVAILDTSPNLDDNLKASVKNSDYIILVTTPDLISMTESLKAINFLRSMDKHILGVIVNKVRGDDIDYSDTDISQFLGVPVLGRVPYDDNVRIANRLNTPVLYSHPNTKFSEAIKKIAADLTGVEYKKVSFFKKLVR